MRFLDYDLYDEKVKYLMSTDAYLEKLITSIGSVSVEIEDDGFRCLVKYIIGQQISDKARETIWQRMNALYKYVTPESIILLGDETLKMVGISGRKMRCIKSLAVDIVEKKLNLFELAQNSNEKIIKELTSVKGIGRWTAEMYLIFSLGREDVLSSGDGTIRRALQWMYHLEEVPSPSAATQCFSRWSRYATIVSIYFWKAIELGLIKKNFDEIG